MRDKPSSKKAVVAIVIAVIVLAYLIFPFDLIPDVAVGAGQVDDVIVALIGIALEVVNVISGKKTKGGSDINGKKSKEEYEDVNYREIN